MTIARRRARTRRENSLLFTAWTYSYRGAMILGLALVVFYAISDITNGG